MITQVSFPILAYSWIIQTPYLFIKKMDKSVFQHHGTGIPREIRIFFDVNDIKVAEKRDIIIKYKNDYYKAYIECDSMNRTRLLWHSDFANCIKNELTKWCDFFKYYNEYKDICPEMNFIKEDINIYSISFFDYALEWVEGRPLTIKEKEIEINYNNNFLENKYGRKINYIEKAKFQNEIGFIGECYVIDYEKRNLIQSKRNDLAEKVEHISITKGDGLGFDILSFKTNGEPKFIEVKTTTKEDNYFYITDNELKFSKDYSGHFYLYRLSNFDINLNKANLNIRQGNLLGLLELKSILFKAKFK